MANILDCLPKHINVKEYVSKIDADCMGEEYEDAHLLLTVIEDEFQLSYACYNKYEGGVSAHFPFADEDLYFAQHYGYVLPLNGGIKGKDVDALGEQMLQWLSENNFI